MKITMISDTHGYHDQAKIPAGDMILHAGDVSKTGNKKEIIEFLEWFEKLDFKYKIFVAGNHDFYFEKESAKTIQQIMPKSIIYLNDSGIEIEGIKIWGSPVQPWFFNWAFNRQRGVDIKKHWDLIPEETDVLITHGPPYGILDKTVKNEPVGCKDLLDKIKKTKIKLHLFGHIHEAYGMQKIDQVTYVNASLVNYDYHLVNHCVELEYDGV